MAVYTHITSEQMSAFLTQYAIGSLQSFSGITGGVSNSNYLLHTSDDKFIVTIFEEKTDTTELPYFVSLMEFLAAGGINCPQPVKNRGGEALTTLGGKPCVIVTFLKGTSISIPNEKHCLEMGRALANFHLKGLSFPMRRQDSMGIAQWQFYFDKVKVACVREDDVMQLFQDELDFLKSNLPKEGDLPEGVIHADCFPDNVFFLDDKLTGIIDFYFSCHGPLAYDLAICVNAWCFGQSPNIGYQQPLARALVEGYESVRPLEAIEKESLPVFLRAGALRFLSTRLYDKTFVAEDAHVEPLEPLDFVKRLEHFRAGQSVVL